MTLRFAFGFVSFCTSRVCTMWHKTISNVPHNFKCWNGAHELVYMCTHVWMFFSFSIAKTIQIDLRLMKKMESLCWKCILSQIIYGNPISFAFAVIRKSTKKERFEFGMAHICFEFTFLNAECSRWKKGFRDLKFRCISSSNLLCVCVCGVDWTHILHF